MFRPSRRMDSFSCSSSFRFSCRVLVVSRTQVQILFRRLVATTDGLCWFAWSLRAVISSNGVLPW